eukprot:TRINITY_DN90_c4_g1_i3.p1 TRINITY_DN90_c4_g1~~TRINITY_DN90_c4_g1_i3.p1  ORF type:complete len:217 (+),score=53.75 TRINITY_DN90_c4_g1_i3:612-1262(+)
MLASLVVLLLVSAINSQSIDWRTKGVLPPVSDQGQLGFSAPIAAVEAIEAAVAIAHGGPPPQLSVENLVDCVEDYDDISENFNYAIENGVDLASSYPPSTGQCSFNPAWVGGKLKGYINVTTESDLIAQLKNGPAAVYINAQPWMTYSGGIFSGPCPTDNIDHVALVVGFEVQDNTAYWIIQNSWGANWGINGYIYLQAGSNLCGIGTSPIIPIAL